MTTATLSEPAVGSDTDRHQALLRRFDIPGPRYTSYPTADRFAPGVGLEQVQAALARRAEQAAAGVAPPLGLYVHLPFCASVCYYCACNKVITKHHERAAAYLDRLAEEIDLVVRGLGGAPRQAVHQLHLGGGTPTFLSDDELARLMQMLRSAFDVVPGAECSIEVDPRTVDAGRLRNLAALGFNRLSLGVQDLDPAVQKAVHRIQPLADIQALFESARAIGFDSINVDLIYGLPLQTAASFASTIDAIAALRPDRIALYGYAHLPHRFAPQRRIRTQDLPGAGQRVGLLADASATLRACGYRHIGMDHFALANDALAVAQREGRLRRNFQGYTVGCGHDDAPPDDLLAFGVSAISQLGGTQWQNAKALPDYERTVHEGLLAVERGHVSNADDQLRREVIMALMCRGRVEWPAVEARHGIRAAEYFAPEFAALAEMAEAGVLRFERGPDALQLEPAGWNVVRVVAMAFDAHLRRRAAAGDTAPRFSRVL